MEAATAAAIAATKGESQAKFADALHMRGLLVQLYQLYHCFACPIPMHRDRERAAGRREQNHGTDRGTGQTATRIGGRVELDQTARFCWKIPAEQHDGIGAASAGREKSFP